MLYKAYLLILLPKSGYSNASMSTVRISDVNMLVPGREYSLLTRAVSEFDARTMRNLLFYGADMDDIAEFEWVLRTNIFPEGDDKNNLRAEKYKTFLDTGAEI
jgi:hypothetical protein